jgi:hypothetical protein
MNESTLTQLKIVVERAVRPIPAGTASKLRIREELLAHLTSVYEEELARLGEEQAALLQTQQRFGNPDELTGQLLKSVPGKETADRFMGRVVLVTVVWLVLFGPAELPVFPGRFLLDFGLFGIGFIFLADLMRRAFSGRSWRQAILIAVVSACLFVGLLFSSLEFSLAEWSKPMDMFNLFMLMAVLTWGLVVPALETAARIRSYIQWERLQIE